MTEWKNVLQTVGAALGSEAGDCVLEFLKVLPEEVIEGRKINLTVCFGRVNTRSCVRLPCAVLQQRPSLRGQRQNQNLIQRSS
jgi:hypothetical protein